MSIYSNAVGGVFAMMQQTKETKAAGANERNFADVLQEAGAQTSAVDKFLKYQAMSPAEKIRASFLSQKGLTEDDVKAMSADERQKLEKQIAEAIREKMHATAGNGGSSVATS